MTNNKAAILLNCFVYPGAGHFKLKHFYRGAFFISITTLTAIYLMAWITQQIHSMVSDMLERGESVLSILALTPSIKESLYNSPIPIIKYTLLTLIITWLFSIIDIVYLIKNEKTNLT